MWESVYGLMNEHGLAIGESSTSARISAPGVDLPNPTTLEKGPALFSIAALIRVAMERCKTSLCAVQTMGSISQRHGFYAETFGAGESLSIIDTEGECWIFNICPDTTGTGSIWVARRVPDGHVAVLANQYTIREVNTSDPTNYQWSDNLFSEALQAGLWDQNSTFRFNEVYGSPGDLPMYVSLRMWRVYDRVAPSLRLRPVVNPFELPFSVPVDAKVSLEDLMSIYRDHYEGTEFDLTKGILAGPFGNPNRVEGGAGQKVIHGQVARAISIMRTAYTMIAVANASGPVLYYATDAPATSVFVPFLASTLKEARAEDLASSTQLYSPAFQTGNKALFDRTSAWWAFDFVANWMEMNYQNMSTTYVAPAVAQWQRDMVAAAASGSTATVRQAQTDLVRAWWTLADLLIVRYNDGLFNFPPDKPTECFSTGYPKEYLEQIGYADDFVFPQFVEKNPAAVSRAGLSQEMNQTMADLYFFKTVTFPSVDRTITVNVSSLRGMVVVGGGEHKTLSISNTPTAVHSSSTVISTNADERKYVQAGAAPTMETAQAPYGATGSVAWSITMISVGLAIGMYISSARKTFGQPVVQSDLRDYLRANE